MNLMPNLIGLTPVLTGLPRKNSVGSTGEICTPKTTIIENVCVESVEKIPKVKKRIRKNSKDLNQKILPPATHQNNTSQPAPNLPGFFKCQTPIEKKWLRSSLPIEAIMHLCIYTRMTGYSLYERIEVANELLRNHIGLIRYLMQQTDNEMLSHLKFFRELGDLLKEMN